MDARVYTWTRAHGMNVDVWKPYKISQARHSRFPCQIRSIDIATNSRDLQRQVDGKTQ